MWGSGYDPAGLAGIDSFGDAAQRELEGTPSDGVAQTDTRSLPLDVHGASCTSDEAPGPAEDMQLLSSVCDSLQTSATCPVAINLPPRCDLQRVLAGLVQRDGPTYILNALLHSVPADMITAILEWKRNGDDPDVAQQERVRNGETDRVGRPATLLLTKFKSLAVESSTPDHFRFVRCYQCEPFKEKEVPGECVAVQALQQLEADFDDQTKVVEEAVSDEGHDLAGARRSARHFLYRRYVRIKFGHLGQSVRVRIPPCVVETIRDRFREPDCTCVLGGELFKCGKYTGHKEASDKGSIIELR